jgi:predicted ATP-grasp superfamily ATP-dependent carboligase
MQDKIVVVFSGFNQRAVIAFLRTLKNNGVSYVIIAKSKEDSIFDTDYKDQVCIIREKPEFEINDLLQIFQKVKIITKQNKCFVCPSTEALNRFLLDNRDVFEKEGVIIPLINKSLYEQISDKYSFCKLCEKYKITVPPSEANIDSIKIPFVAKPYLYFNKNKETLAPQLIHTEKDKKLFENKFNTNDFYYQQFIGGQSYYLLYYFDRKGNVYKYSQENIAQQPCGKSIVAAISSTIHQTDISTKFEFMLKTIDFKGLIMIEIKKEDGKYYMIEANPRLWGPSQFFIDSQMNFFDIFLYDNEIIQTNPDFSHPIASKYFWYGGVIECERKNTSIIYHIEDSIKNNLENWVIHDIYKRKDTITIFEKEIKL